MTSLHPDMRDPIEGICEQQMRTSISAFIVNLLQYADIKYVPFISVMLDHR